MLRPADAKRVAASDHTPGSRGALDLDNAARSPAVVMMSGVSSVPAASEVATAASLGG